MTSPTPSADAPAVVQPGSFLTLHYRLAGPAGDVVNTFADKPATLSLGNGELSPTLEARLIGLAEGVHATFELAPGEGFGEHNPQMLQWVARSLLAQLGDVDDVYAPGDVVQFPAPPDGESRYAGTVVESSETAVRFDFNHPLAGQPITFEVQLIGVL